MKGKIKNERKIVGRSQNSSLNVQEHGPTISVNWSRTLCVLFAKIRLGFT
jgi:hypothetical protein